jgi:hypothetical protein
MKSEKRFSVLYGLEDESPMDWSIIDNETNSIINPMNGTAIVDLLNYQAQIIKEQHDEIIDWTKKYVELKKENEQLRKDLKTVIDSYDCERIGYCHKGEYCKKWSLNNDR